MTELKSSVIKTMTVPELAAAFGVSAYSIRELVKTGKLPVLKLGNKWLIRVADFNALFVTSRENDRD